MNTNSQAKVLGYGGLLPFAAAVAALATGVSTELAREAIVAYGAVIVSFVGAVHWGIAVGHRETRPQWVLTVSVVPALIAWAALLLPPAMAAPLLLLSFLGLFAYERAVLWRELFPKWYRVLRARLTAAVTVLLAVAWMLILLRD